MAQIDFGGVVEEVITSEEFTLDEAREVLSKETVAVLGYGVQGPGQALNMRDNGIQVIVGQREGGASWDRAVADGFVPGQTLFPVEEAARRGTIIQYLLSDAGQSAMWPKIKDCLNEGDALYFSHGFSVVYKEQTGVVPPANVDVILVAPKGSGLNVRRNFLSGAGINSSYAVEQDATGRAEERCLALGIGLGSGIAGIAGVALSQLTNVGPNLGQAYIVDSFMVVVFGGVGNLWGTLVGGLGLGIANKLMEPWAGAVLAKILLLVFIILFIQKRPRGLFPQKGRAAEN